MHIFIILPNQLFPYKFIKKYILLSYQIYLLEEPRYFTDYKFHKLKLVYHRATMKKYYDDLVDKKYNIKYIEFHQINNEFYSKISKNNILMFDPVDHKLEHKFS